MIITCIIQKVKSVLGIDRFFGSPLFCQEQAGHFGLVGIGIEQEADGHEGKEGQNNQNSWLWWLLKLFPLSNVLKSGTLLSATPERHSQNRERRRSATPFYQKERCGSGTHFFEESENMSGPLLSLFFF